MNNPIVSNPKDDIVVTFHNNTEFGFTTEMGCMYDGRSINGISGQPGIAMGESKLLPYHVGHRLAINLAKRILNTSKPAEVDAAGIPTGVAVWDEEKLQTLANSFIKEEYADARPVMMSETDKLMAKVAELEKFVKENVSSKPTETVTETPEVEDEKVESTEKVAQPEVDETPKVFQDKQEVIAELEKREIKFDRRASKANLEKLLA